MSWPIGYTGKGIMDMYIDMIRNKVTPAQFVAAAKARIKATTLAGWLGTLDVIDEYLDAESIYIHAYPDDDRPFEEILAYGDGSCQMYFSPTPAGYERGYTGYNFMYEFTFDTEKTGHGYLHVSEF